MPLKYLRFLLFPFLCLLLFYSPCFPATLATERIGYVDIDRIYSECPDAKAKEEERKAEIEKRNKLISSRKDELKRLRSDYEALKSSQAFEIRRYEEEKKAYDEFFAGLESKKQEPEAPLPPSEEGGLNTVATDTAPAQQVSEPEASPPPEPAQQLREPDPPRPALISDADLKKAEENIKTLEDDILFQEEGYEKNISKYDNAVQYNILGRIYEAIKETAEEHNYTIILDRRAVFFYLKESDLTDLVIKRLQGK